MPYPIRVFRLVHVATDCMAVKMFAPPRTTDSEITAFLQKYRYWLDTGVYRLETYEIIG